ncbi:diphosphomevalonate decarboxylase [Luteibacter yeojuensis]
MKKVTAIAPANIALIKYWGMRDEEFTLPANPSISMTLRECVSTCTVAARDDGATEDEVLWVDIGGRVGSAPPWLRSGVVRQVERLRQYVGKTVALRIATSNSFPTGAGMASSASGFAALTMAVGSFLGGPSTGDTLSRLARLSGSGSAARSLLGGFVEWPGSADDPDSPARQLFAAGHWPLCDVVAVVDPMPKSISSREGHRRAPGSPYFARRQELLPARAERVWRAVGDRDFDRFAEAVEEEAIDLHLIAMSARPPCFYWQPATLAVLQAVRMLRGEKANVCATIDAGPNVHVLCLPAEVPRLSHVLSRVAGVHSIIVDRIGEGPRFVDEHLF